MMQERLQSKKRQPDEPKRGPLPSKPEEIGMVTRAWRGMMAPLWVMVQIAALIACHVECHVPLNNAIIRPIVFASLLAANIQWRPSKYWVYTFVKRLGYSYRRGTTAARKLPRSFPSIKEAFIYRFVWLVVKFELLPEMVFNFDETGVRFLQVLFFNLF
jgi:hypothetical protein